MLRSWIVCKGDLFKLNIKNTRSEGKLCRKQYIGQGKKMCFSVYAWGSHWLSSPREGGRKASLHGIKLHSLVYAFPGPPVTSTWSSSSRQLLLNVRQVHVTHHSLHFPPGFCISVAFLGSFTSEPYGHTHFLGCRSPTCILALLQKWGKKIFSWPGPEISLELQPVGISVVSCPLRNPPELSGGTL